MQFTFDRPEEKPPLTEFDLINYETYEDYLDSLYNDLDRCYLQDTNMCRKIAEFGYRRDGNTFSRQEFEQKRKKVQFYLSPLKPNINASTGFRFGDAAQNALALRERANRTGIMTTIIFIKYGTSSYTASNDREISGYIDYAHSLIKKDWKKFFKENQPMYPDRYDLGFYNWKKDATVINDSLYYKTLMSPTKGLVFQNKFDRMLIVPDPFAIIPGQKTTRVRVRTKMYNNFVLIDHILRSRK
ncbi:hypothetical protein HUJ04_002065 [Dendroctonus ponderosae]|nr:hypothetical protein HUJ04_002065 [Dendroctonus ponderosae]